MEGFKNPSHGNCPLRGGGGYPPFPFRKNPLKIGPKTVFIAQKTPFSALSVNFFPLTFRENVVRDGPGGGGKMRYEFFVPIAIYTLLTVHKM